jgi:hypothetical protein
MTHHEELFDGNERGHPDILTFYAVKEDPAKLPFSLFLPIKKAAEWSIFLDFCTSKGFKRHEGAWNQFQEILLSAPHRKQVLPARRKKKEPYISNVTATSNGEKYVRCYRALDSHWK